MKYEISARAEEALQHIYAYTFTNFGEAQADQYLDRLGTTFSLLADNPAMGRNWHGPVRRFLAQDYWIYYRVLPDYLFITDIQSAKLKPPEEPI